MIMARIQKSMLLTLAALYTGYRLWGLMGMLLAPILAVAAAQLTDIRKQ